MTINTFIGILIPFLGTSLGSAFVLFMKKEISLTTTEFDLLVLLIKNNGNIVTRDEILNEVWGYEKSVSTNVVEVYIRYLRNKLPDIKIETIRGIGYRLIWKKITLFAFN